MYGYVRTDTPSLRVYEYEEYKGVYCSLCRILGKRYGILSRLLLSYDLTFLAMFLLGLEGGCTFTPGRCPFNPAKKCTFLKQRHTALEYCADITVIMAYHKLLDNIQDEGFFKRILCRLALPYLSLLYRKAKKNRSETAELVENMMGEQALAEQNFQGIDALCEPTAKCLGVIASYGETDEEIRKIRYRFGYCIGRWIYLCDAFDDIEDDLKKGGFNPFVRKYKLDNGGDMAVAKSEAVATLNITAGALTECFEELKFNRFGGIIENIVRDGLYAKTEQIKNKEVTPDESL